IESFLKKNGTDPLLKAHSRDLGDALVKLLDSSLLATPERSVDKQTLAQVGDAERVLAEVQKVLPDAVPTEERSKKVERFKEYRVIEQRNAERKEMLASIDRQVQRPTIEAIKDVRKLLAQKARTHPE